MTNTYGGAGLRPRSLACRVRHAHCVLVQLALRARQTNRSKTMRVLMIDNYDSFTYNLVQYLGELGAEVETVRNDRATVDELLRVGSIAA